MKIQTPILKNGMLGLMLSLWVFRSDAQDNQTSLLWKIEGASLSKPSYLFGTLHIACPEDINLTGNLEKAILGSDEIYLELDMDAPDFLAQMQKNMMNPQGKNFSNDLTKEQKKKLNDFFIGNYGRSIETLGVLKPLGLLHMIVMKFVDCPQPGSYEMSIVQLAQANEIEIRGLESVAFQTDLFDKIPQKESVQWLVDAVDQQKSKKEFNQMLEAYKANDPDQLYKLMEEINPEFKNYEELLISGRNKNWIPLIKNACKERSIFIAVGAGHLMGLNGVVQLLKKEGLTVSPVQF